MRAAIFVGKVRRRDFRKRQCPVFAKTRIRFFAISRMWDVLSMPHRLDN